MNLHLICMLKSKLCKGLLPVDFSAAAHTLQ